MTNTPQTPQRDKYVKVGMVAFFVLAGILLLFFFLFKINSVKSAFITLTEILQPIILGIVVAYLVNPIMQTIDKPFSTFFVKVCRFKKRGAKIARGFSVALAIILFLGLIAAIVYLITPQFIESAVSMIETLPAQIDIAIKHITDFVGKNELLSAVATNALDYGKDWLENDLPEFVTSYAGKVATGVVKTAGFLSDLIIGFIVAVYVLMSKETFKAQFKKMLYAFAGQKPSESVLTVLKKSNEVFSGFITGKIIDSIIMGILCFIGTSLLNIPYAALVSIIVGVTNIIPFFGPFIGAIPSTLLILIVDPLKGLYFLIFIILLQQFDGNVLGPKILGDSTGLSPFWVIFSIVVAGGLFGFLGMLLGVPLFAVIYYLINESVRYKLSKKQLPVETEVYMSGAPIEPTDRETPSLEEPIPETLEEPQQKGETPVRKKDLINKTNDLINTVNTLNTRLGDLDRENAELRAQIEELKVAAQTQPEPVCEETVFEEETLPATNPEVEIAEQEQEPDEIIEEAVVLPQEASAHKSEAQQEDVSVPAIDLDDKAIEYGADAIGMIVKESVKYANIISSSSSDDKKELLNLIMGKAEIAKTDIFSIAEGDAERDTKQELITAVLDETIDYFKSVAGQI